MITRVIRELDELSGLSVHGQIDNTKCLLVRCELDEEVKLGSYSSDKWDVYCFFAEFFEGWTLTSAYVLELPGFNLEEVQHELLLSRLEDEVIGWIHRSC